MRVVSVAGAAALVLILGWGCKSDDAAAPVNPGGSGGTMSTLASSTGAPATSTTNANTSAAGGASSAATAMTTTATTSGSTTTGPAITEAPPAWVRPADCGGVGNLCPNLSGCEAGSTCQLEGNVCIPAFDPTLGLPGRSAETPYCAAYTCMTFDEASCFCTGDAGANYDACSSPERLAGLCRGQNDVCDDGTCCAGLSCVLAGLGFSQCEISCTSDTDCDSGCCTDLHDTGDLVCADLESCQNPCKREGEACTPSDGIVSDDCCRGNCVQSDAPDFAGCRPACNTNEDCETGCCQPFSNVPGGFCVDALYCSCSDVGGPCGAPDVPTCCEGTRCAGTGADGAFLCNQECTQNSECASNCCAPVSTGEYMICLGPEYCP